MKTTAKLGIFMDHSNAQVIEYIDSAIPKNTIESSFTHESKVEGLLKNEAMMHNKEQHQQKEYYKKIADVIRNYDAVLLFGPTNAKAELANLLKDDNHFLNTRVALKDTDKITSLEQCKLVEEHFTKH
jgi:hypothetical protein